MYLSGRLDRKKEKSEGKMVVLKAVCGMVWVFSLGEKRGERLKESGERETVFFLMISAARTAALMLPSCFGMDGWKVEVRIVEEVYPNCSHLWGHVFADSVGIGQVDR